MKISTENLINKYLYVNGVNGYIIIKCDVYTANSIKSYVSYINEGHISYTVYFKKIGIGEDAICVINIDHLPDFQSSAYEKWDELIEMLTEWHHNKDIKIIPVKQWLKYWQFKNNTQ